MATPAGAATPTNMNRAEQSGYRLLANPTGGDDFLFRGAIQQNAQGMSDKMFAALQSLLGGSSPTLNFVQDGDVVDGKNFSATPTANRINIDPFGTIALTSPRSNYHYSAVQSLPHENAHLRQIAPVQASKPVSEGGAQAFADLVTEDAAKKAGINFVAGPPGYYDMDYADYVKNVMDNLGKAFVLYQQFGRTAP